MYLPISLSIYCGALSPSVLESRRCTDDCLRKDIRRLAVLPATLPELIELLTDVLRNYGVDFPAYTFISSPPQADFCGADLYSPLNALRQDELDSHLRLSTDMEMLTLRHAFYNALLRAEARCIKLSLEERIARLRSDNDARVLLLRVLRQIYTLGCQVGIDSVCINMSLATLYLDLTIAFGFLLRPTDYLDFHDLLCDPHFRRCILPGEEEKYIILQDENLVKALVNGREVRFLEEYFSAARAASPADASLLEERAGQLYEELAVLVVGLSFVPAAHHPLLRGLTALENHLFFHYSGLQQEGGDRFARFTDGSWISLRYTDLCSSRYGDDKRYVEARSAYDWVTAQLNKPCFSFLHPGITLADSLPRRLYAYLLERKQLYAEHFASSFAPVQPVKDLPVVSLQHDASMAVDETELHSMLAFLYKQSTSWLLQPAQARSLEVFFVHFLRTHTIITLSATKKIKIRSGFSELLYGLFLYYCSKRGVKAEECAKFLIEVFETQATLQTFYKNGSHRYIQKYMAFCRENSLNPG